MLGGEFGPEPGSSKRKVAGSSLHALSIRDATTLVPQAPGERRGTLSRPACAGLPGGQAGGFLLRPGLRLAAGELDDEP